MPKFHGEREKEVFISRMNAKISWRKRERGFHQVNDRQNFMEKEKKWRSSGE
ncbi:hypothetical protein [Niallia circulans]|uniref:Uncharacterized protein n=1 Tax=Niallia circulans TaxID=1397 RepID=A0A941JNJ9_NIACI|nr:hypothetical protein [Niallia circulans]MCB5239529.1 hypothetical protein [Niallia circulans]